MNDDDLRAEMAGLRATLQHLVKLAEQSARDAEARRAEQSKQNERLTRVESRLDHIDRQMPQISRSALHDAESDGWKDAKQDAQHDRVSILALLVAALSTGATILHMAGVFG